MAYQSVQLDSELSIEKIYTIHYYEYQNDFYFSGERHNFWEFQCVDKGSAKNGKKRRYSFWRTEAFDFVS